MAPKKSDRSKDIRGAAKLTVDAIHGITDIVESLHATILRFGRKPQTPDQHRTKGISGLVYSGIRSVTKQVETGADVLLDRMGHLLGEKSFSPNREIALASLNGVIGDYLEEKKNPLAIDMKFRKNGVELSNEEIEKAVKQANGKLVILIHGLCMNDLQWNRKEHDHGMSLTNEIGCASIYLHYNSGKHVSQNGSDFSQLLEQLIKLLPDNTSISIIGHSMGGLVSRSACYYAERQEYNWIKQLKKMVFIGTPHHGALLEKGGNWIDMLLTKNAYSAPFAKLGKIRSSGITDMRYGYITEDDWMGHDRFEFNLNHRKNVALPSGMSCYAIAGTTMDSPKAFNEEIIGDGLVIVSSALGHHHDPVWVLNIPKENQHVVRKVGHLDLLSDSKVYKKLKEWMD